MDEIPAIREIAAYLKISRTTVWRGWRVRRVEMEKLLGQPLGEDELADRRYQE